MVLHVARLDAPLLSLRAAAAVNIEKAMREVSAMLAEHATTPDYLLLGEEPCAVFCVCAFLRWAFEVSYTVEDWCEECDIYLLTYPEDGTRR